MKLKSVVIAILIGSLIGFGGVFVGYDDITIMMGETVSEQDKDIIDRSTPNPWGEEIIRVVVLNNADPDRNYTKFASSAISYWNSNISKLGYKGEFKIVSNDSDDVDVRINIVNNIDECGVEDGDEFVGCADYIKKGEFVTTPTNVRIEAGYSDKATRDTTIHELGHTLGLKHSDSEEWDIMEAKGVKTTEPKPNATERDNAWGKEMIYVDYELSNLEQEKREVAEDEIKSAARYYTNGADGSIPKDVVVEIVDSKEKSDIQVTVVDDLKTGSTAKWRGVDPDGDGSMERYTSADIKIDSNTQVRHYGWHVGYWIGQTFGAKSKSDLPDPFNGDDTKEREEPYI